MLGLDPFFGEHEQGVRGQRGVLVFGQGVELLSRLLASPVGSIGEAEVIASVSRDVLRRFLSGQDRFEDGDRFLGLARIERGAAVDQEDVDEMGMLRKLFLKRRRQGRGLGRVCGA